MATDGGEELRIALSMRGGVSLAVWIGGAVEELDRLTRVRALPHDHLVGVGGPDFYAALLTIGGYDRAVLDVITGASAGGLNGVVLAASRAYGFDFAEMLPLWVRLGDIELLTRDPVAIYTDPQTGERTRRPDSLLQGNEYFQKRLRTQLRELISRGQADHAVDDSFDLILSATLVNPLYETTDADPFAPLPEVRRNANFHFRYLGELGAYGGDFQAADEATRLTDDSTASLLALAGRSTSSFPVAFEPAQVGREAARVFSDPPNADEPARLVLDGGVLDNIPVAKAIEAIASAPVRGKADRWLVFLHPSPSARTEQAAEVKGLASPRAFGTLLVTASAAFGQESLLDDLEELKRHNAKAAEQRWRRLALLANFDVTQELDPGVVSASRAARAQLDAARALKIVLGELRIRRPITEGIDRVRTSDWLRRVRGRLPQDIVDGYQAVYDERATGSTDAADSSATLSAGGLLLACDIVGEWVRSAEPNGSVAGAVAVLRGCTRRVTDLRALAQLGQNWSDQAWLVASSHGPDPATPWARNTAATAVAASRAVPCEALRAVEAALGLSDDATPAEAAEITDAQRTTALARLDEEMRSIVGALCTVPNGCDLGAEMWKQLVAVADSCRTAGSQQGLALARSKAVHDPLWTAAANTLGTTLANIVTVSTQAQSADLVSDDEVRFIRITGSNDTPLRNAFVGEGQPFGVDEKLCGNDLANFAAFFSAKWRANDWMWGRLDAVKSIVDLLVRPERLHASALPTAGVVELVRHLAERAGMPLDHATVTAIEVEVGVAKAGGSGSPQSTMLIRRVLTEAMQRQIFAQMHPVIERLAERPHWPDAPSATGPLSPIDVGDATLNDKMRRYDVGTQTIADLDSRRRTQIGMRMAMVAYRAFQPGRRGYPSRFARLLIGVTKPLYLFGAFAALNVARALFLVNMTAVGFWVGPWRYRNEPNEQRQPWRRWTTGGFHPPWSRRGRWWVTPVAPTFRNWSAIIGFSIVVLLSTISLVLAVRVFRQRRRARRRQRTPPQGLVWYLTSFIGGLGALAVSTTTGLCSGPITVVIGAGLVALLTCQWMRKTAALIYVPVGTMAMYALTGLAFWPYSSVKHRPWFSYSGWMSVIALYLAQVLISVLCTFTSVLYKESELLAQAAHPRRRRWLQALRTSA